MCPKLILPLVIWCDKNGILTLLVTVNIHLILLLLAFDE